MNKYQNMILWIGIGLVLVYLFAGNGGIFKSVFTTPSSSSPPKPSLGLQNPGASSTGNGQSNTGNTGTAKVPTGMSGTTAHTVSSTP